jgi:DNA-binding NarL/FixJ family response regulator
VIKVQIIERSPIFLAGLVDTFSRDGFQVSSAGTSFSGGFTWSTDVLVVDPDALGEVELEEFAYAAARIAPVLLVLYTAAQASIERYARAGVAGYVERTASPGTVLDAARTVVRGGRRFGTVAAPVGEREKSPLSPRERQVLRHIARGLTHGQVARLLEISPHTVDTHVKRIRAKLELGNKADLTRAAVLGGSFEV